MNDRIRDIAIKSGIYDCITDPYDKYETGDSNSSIMYDLERFAELIVQECAKSVVDFYKEDEFTCYSAAEEIKKHFGVE